MLSKLFLTFSTHEGLFYERVFFEIEATEKIDGNVSKITCSSYFLPELVDLIKPPFRRSRAKILFIASLFNLCDLLKSLIGNCPK